MTISRENRGWKALYLIAPLENPETPSLPNKESRFAVVAWVGELADSTHKTVLLDVKSGDFQEITTGVSRDWYKRWDWENSKVQLHHGTETWCKDWADYLFENVNERGSKSNGPVLIPCLSPHLCQSIDLAKDLTELPGFRLVAKPVLEDFLASIVRQGISRLSNLTSSYSRLGIESCTYFGQSGEKKICEKQ